MANVIKEGNTLTELTLDEDYTTSFHVFHSCVFTPFTAGDTLVLQECPVDYGTTSIATTNWPSLILRSEGKGTLGYIFKGKRRSKLHIPYSRCTFSNAASTSITLEYC